MIHINLKHPECTQCPFKVKTATLLKGLEENKTFQGYFCEMRVHPCNAMGQGEHLPFDFKAHIHSSNEIIIEAPMLDFTDMGKDDEEMQGLKQASHDSTSH